MINIQKAAVIGCGFVGASTAFSLVQKGLFSELVLIDANKEKAEGEAMDLSHGRPFVHSMKIYAGDYDDISDCALIIITAGANQKPGETRLDLVHKNVAIFKSIIPEITKRNFEGNLLIVANPVDIQYGIYNIRTNRDFHRKTAVLLCSQDTGTVIIQCNKRIRDGGKEKVLLCICHHALLDFSEDQPQNLSIK